MDDNVLGQAIYSAARDGSADELRDLVGGWEGNEDVLNWADGYNWTPVFVATLNRNVEAATILINTRGVDLNRPARGCWNGYTLLSMARYRRKYSAEVLERGEMSEIISLLKTKGALDMCNG